HATHRRLSRLLPACQPAMSKPSPVPMVRPERLSSGLVRDYHATPVGARPRGLSSASPGWWEPGNALAVALYSLLLTATNLISPQCAVLICSQDHAVSSIWCALVEPSPSGIIRRLWLCLSRAITRPPRALSKPLYGAGWHVRSCLRWCTIRS